ncbi:trimethyltridecatetraene synthase-like [Prosopis cineraria]|uniref:trimethyltridecatetraene synthase-like n=1 Tax=Prosopis cineraria TaxID=364024 RepID=UPI00240EB7B0|nr:trimethyltridecatetraene synthase-like [Prosopis cineraria]
MAMMAIFLLLLLQRLFHHRNNRPPGPKPRPIIGNLNLIGAVPHLAFHALSKKYGPIMHLKLGFKDIVVASSSDVAKAFLKTHGFTFSSRPQTSAGKYTAYNYSSILWAPYGPHWRQARKICNTKLFSHKSLESYEYIRKEEMKSILKKLFTSSGTTILLKDYLYTLSLNNISRMALGKNGDSYVYRSFLFGEITIRARQGQFRKLLDEFSLLNTFVNIGDLIPWINFLDLQGYMKRMKDFSMKFDRFLEHVLDEHEEKRKRVENYVARDMMDVLLQLAEDSTFEVKLQRHTVKALTQAIGRDPTIWENPNMFFPERFIGKDIDVVGHHFELLPFAIGRRICPGYTLALKVVQSCLANLVHGFSWSLPNNMIEMDLNMKETFRLTNFKKLLLEAIIKPKLSSYLYF